MALLTHWYQWAVQHPYDTFWNGVGFLGQAVFGVRFFIQWLKSESEGHSVIPLAFWYCSIVGALISLTYYVHLKSLPLILGSSPALLIYARNIWMIYRDRGKARPA